MTTFEWLSAAQMVMLALGALLVFSLRTGIRGGQWTAGQEARLLQIERRLVEAGQKMSDLTDLVQKLPDTLRKEFLPRELATQTHSESVEDRKRMERRIDIIEAQLRKP